MYISKIQVLNYKSFLDSGELEFNPGMNIIVGQNNAGKTALLEALTLNFPALPHRSIKTLPSPNTKLNDISQVILTLTIEKEELRLLIDKIEPLLIPRQKNVKTGAKDSFELFFKWLSHPEPMQLSITIPSNNSQFIVANNKLNEISFGYDPPPPSANNQYGVIRKYLPEISSQDYAYEFTNTGIDNHPGYRIFNFFKHTIYRFRAERLNISSCGFGQQDILQPNASNLAEVLNVLLMKNPSRWNRFNELVSTIFPDIQRISIEPRQNQVEIKIWHIDPDTEREDLSFPLSECGTGISQVLAILYVVITSPEPRTIIIDEPQSFLHPGAAKKLIEILKQFPQHQYFIATHSPQIVTAANPSTIMQLRYKDNETKAESINSLNTVQMRSLLSDVGVSLSDVFGADNILWVEGATEELCFPMILEKVAKQPLKGTQIVGIKNTGDLEGKHAAIIFEIYRRLSGGNTLFPPAIGFLLDSEGKNDKQKEDLRRAANNLEKDVEQQKQVSAKKGIPVKFLARRMYENYLLHPKAIASVLNNIFNEYEDLGGKNVTDVDIQEFIEQKRTNGDYVPKGTNKEALSHTEWVAKIHGANILKDLFDQFAGPLVRFDKTKHSPLITEWLVENEPQHLVELAKLLEDMLNHNTQDK